MMLLALIATLIFPSSLPARPTRLATHLATRPTNVGFEKVAMPFGTQPPITVGIWYPTEAVPKPERLGGWTQMVAKSAPVAPGRHPLVVMSHGNGGWFAGHHDTALALAHAGFVVAALTHPGDNYQDQSRATDIPLRVAAVSRLIDYMLDEWPPHGTMDPERVGIFGFSAGGLTALVASGGVPDLSTFAGHCHEHPHDADCLIVAAAGMEFDELATRFPPSVWKHDSRIRAAVVAAPAIGFTFLPHGLQKVTIPVQIWRAADDTVLPYPEYADAARRALPKPPEYHVVPDAGHYDFLAPCDSATAEEVPEICTSAPGFDRSAFHERFDKAVVAFFRKTLE
jgi:predicted dienelactone hydrolase